MGSGSVAAVYARCVTYQDPRALQRRTVDAGAPAPERPALAAGGHLVGRRVPLLDAREKSLGTVRYTDDLRQAGELVCRIRRSPWAHARIVRIDTSRASALPGVHAVMVGTDAPTTFGVLPISQDETALAVERIRHVGEGVVAVAAESEALADEALALVEIEVEPLPAFLKKDDSVRELRPGETKIHDHTRGTNNIHKRVEQSWGEPEDAFATAPFRAEATFTFQGITHAFTEPIAAVAAPSPDGRITLWTSQQVPHYTHRAVAKVLGLPMHRIRVIKPAVGGGFGGKSDPFPHEMVVCWLAQRAGRPVRILFDREEVFFSNHGRHPTRTDAKMAMDREGRITTLHVDALIDGGAFGSFGVVTAYYNGVLSHGPYHLPSFRYRGTRIYSNRPVSGAMRGHGSVNSRHCAEVLLDDLCHQSGLDPIDVRLRNLLPAYTELQNGFRVTSNGLRECIEWVRDQSGWDARRGKLGRGRGLGIGCGFYISGSALPIHKSRLPHSTVHLKLDMDGGVTIHTGAADIGQGSDTMAAQVVGEVLGLPLPRIRVVAVDTDISPVDLGSYSSRVTFMNGLAARRAAEAMRDELIAAAARISGHAAEHFVARDGMLVHQHWPRASVKFDDALEEALAGRGALTTSGSYTSPPMGSDYKGAGAGLSPSYSFTAYVAEVEVDEETGFVRPVEIWAAHDCGRAINPLAVEGQIEGSIHMGLGQVLSEELDYHEGALLNANLLDYKVPVASQVPPIHVRIVESIDPEGPFGAKECGEGGLAPILPAVANAVFDAVGVRITQLPLRPDVVLAAIEQQRRAAARKAGT